MSRIAEWFRELLLGPRAPVGIVEWFRERLLGPRAPEGRLDRERALEIARPAAAGYPGADRLSMSILQARGSANIWVVSTPTIGDSLVVEIDDATEAVLSVGRVGGR
jgi:hypothetical protein